MGSRDQIARVLALAHALSESRRGIAVRRFAAQRGWPERSVYRDIKTLEKAGFPIVNESGRYRLMDGWRPPEQGGLDRDEALALFTARHVIGAARATSLGRALDRVWAKLSGTGPQAALVPAVDAPIAVRALTGIDYAPHRDTIERLERAIRDRCVVSCRHVRVTTGRETERDLEPGELYLDTGLETMYLIAWCRLRNDVRVFAVHRLRDVDVLDERFTPRASTRSRAALRTAFRVWRSETVETVRLQFTARLAREIAERTWHGSQRMERMSDGGVVLTLEVADVLELERWLLGFGAGVRVLAPRRLAARLLRAHQEAVEAQAPGRGAARTRRRAKKTAGAKKIAGR